MTDRVFLYPGQRVRFLDRVWRTLSFAHRDRVWLAAEDNPDEIVSTLVSELLRAGEMLEYDVDAPDDAATKKLALSLERLRKHDPLLAALAQEYHADQLEARTGYRLGSPELALPGEPKPQYDPATTTLDERLLAMIKSFKERAEMARILGDELRATEYERRGGLSTVKKHWTAFGNGDGYLAFVDSRKLRLKRVWGDLDQAIIDAIARVWKDELVDGPRIRYRHIINLLRLELAKKPETAQLKLPSRKTLTRHLKRWLATKAWEGPTRYKRSRDQIPAGDFDPVHALYPGRDVYVDVVSTNIFAFEEYAYTVVEVRLLAAIDAFSGTVLAARFVLGEPTAGDLVGLVMDICWPRGWRPQWGDESQWRALGVPENLVVAFKVNSLVLDNAFANKGRRLHLLAEELGINLIFARLAAGEDKARLERFFLTVDDQLWQGLHGYRGKDVASRGKHPEKYAYYFVSELEDLFWKWVVEHWQPRPAKGIWPVGHPHAKLSPNEAFDRGRQKLGLVAMPPPKDIAYKSLEPALITIRRDGIRFRHLHYAVPTPLREWVGNDAPYAHYGGKWLAYWDEYDRRFLYMQDPHTGHWLQLSARELRLCGIPLSSDDVDALREQLRKKVGERTPTENDWGAALDDFLVATRAAAAADLKKRKQLAKSKRRELERQQQFEDVPFTVVDLADGGVEPAEQPAPDGAVVPGAMLFVRDPAAIERMRAAAEADTASDNDDDDDDEEVAA